MKEDWLNDIHDRMTDFEVDEPQGLWDSICSAESKNPIIPTINHSKSKRIVFWSGIAAACMLLFGIIHPLLNNHKDGPVSTSELTQIANYKVPEEKGLQVQERGEETENAVIDVIPRAKAMGHVMTEETVSLEKGDTSTLASAEEPINVDSKTASVLAEKRKEPAPAKDRQQIYMATAKHTEPRLAVSLMTSTGNDSKARQMFHGGDVCASSTLGESEWIDSPLLGIMAMNRGVETERKVTHHSPVRAGVSLKYRLNNRWSIDTGISYAFASSEIHEGSTANYVEEEQKFHYIGIPAGLSYRLLTWKKIDVYLSTNILAEKCICAQSSRQFYIANKPQGEEINPIASRPMQWSVGAKAGVQYNLNSIFSIYAEPGCIYYLDDHSSLETVSKERACDFNLNIGLRCTIGK